MYDFICKKEGSGGRFQGSGFRRQETGDRCQVSGQFGLKGFLVSNNHFSNLGDFIN